MAVTFFTWKINYQTVDCNRCKLSVTMAVLPLKCDYFHKARYTKQI